ncbi:MAG TPA: aminodeoxychorismate/anthranilate synthase component II [Acidobacteriota bacterium]|nr:aminodeoxychorismate/anthranilate synthase component II [Acidobacteriota bacterium]
MILVVDNYDSFTYNLVQALGALGAELEVRRNDEIDVQAVCAMAPAGVVLSPGPGRPETAGCCIDLVQRIDEATPLLGVCLGHQALGAAFGAQIELTPEAVHGKTTLVQHDGGTLFEGLSRPLEAARYHSLVVSSRDFPEELEVTATAPGGLIMAMRHRTRPLFGVQFHPESIATREGPTLLRNFLVVASKQLPASSEESR